MFDQTKGHTIYGMHIDDNRFVARVHVMQLFQFAPDPRATADAKSIDGDVGLENLRRLRQATNRAFEGQKSKNVGPYADYIIETSERGDGITPPITLYTPTKLQVEFLENHAFRIHIPWDVRLVPIDGDTQLAARFEALKKAPQTAAAYVAVDICHGRDESWARQAFHDLNTLGVRPNVATSIGMDARDPMTALGRKVGQIPFFAKRVNMRDRQLKKSDDCIVTIVSLRNACVTLIKGIAGIQFGTRPVPIDVAQLQHLTDVAIDWFTAVTTAIGVELEDRQRTLASAPSVLAAIGAMGNGLIKLRDREERQIAARQLASELKAVCWDRSRAWEGIAGKYNTKGNFSVGGTKETAYAVHAALSDKSDLGYAMVRDLKKTAVCL